MRYTLVALTCESHSAAWVSAIQMVSLLMTDHPFLCCIPGATMNIFSEFKKERETRGATIFLLLQNATHFLQKQVLKMLLVVMLHQ